VAARGEIAHATEGQSATAAAAAATTATAAAATARRGGEPGGYRSSHATTSLGDTRESTAAAGTTLPA